LLYDDTSEKLIIKGLLTKDGVENNVASVTPDFNEEYIEKLEKMNDLLKTEIDTKNIQIENLQTILNQQQQLLLYEQQKGTKLLEENKDTKKWWHWWK